MCNIGYTDVKEVKDMIYRLSTCMRYDVNTLNMCKI